MSVVVAAAGAAPASAVLPCSVSNQRNLCLSEDSSGVPDAAEANDAFGGVVAFGDFNHDGFRDLVVGAPGEDGDAGVIYVFYGHASGLTSTGAQLISQGFFAGQVAEAGDRFGAALATGDIDGDGFDDLAVGSPGETALDTCGLFGNSSCDEIGVVNVVYGSPTGLDFLRTQSLLPSQGLAGRASLREHAGTALAMGDFDDDGFADLAVGIPDADNRANNDGQVDVVHGSAGGLNTAREVELGFSVAFTHTPHIGSSVVAGAFKTGNGPMLVMGVPQFGDDERGIVAYCTDVFSCIDPIASLDESDLSGGSDEAGDHFGVALAAGDFNHDGTDDLAIGTPLRDHGAGFPQDSGVVFVLYGNGFSLNNNPSQLLGEDDIAGQSPQAGDLFGSALAAGDVDGDGITDLLVGAPGETVAGHTAAGLVLAFRGSATGLHGAGAADEASLGGTVATGSQLGVALATGDVDGDRLAEVAIGVPAKTVSGHAGAGLVYVTKTFDGRFVDGFESGGTLAWSAKSP